MATSEAMPPRLDEELQRLAIVIREMRAAIVDSRLAIAQSMATARAIDASWNRFYARRGGG